MAAPRGSWWGRPAGSSTVSVPSSASTRRRRPLSPPPHGSAPPTPSSVTDTAQRVAHAGDADVHPRGAGVLAGVGQRLGDHEVGGALDRRPRALGRVDRHRDRDRRGRGQRAGWPRRRPRSASTGGWMPRARSRSSRSASPAPRGPRPAAARAASGSSASFCSAMPRLMPERDQARLGAVVEVALDPAQLGLLHVDGARPARLERRRCARSAPSRSGERSSSAAACAPDRDRAPGASATPARSSRASWPPTRRSGRASNATHTPRGSRSAVLSRRRVQTLRALQHADHPGVDRERQRRSPAIAQIGQK